MMWLICQDGALLNITACTLIQVSYSAADGARVEAYFADSNDCWVVASGDLKWCHKVLDAIKAAIEIRGLAAIAVEPMTKQN